VGSNGENLSGNLIRFSGFADRYDAARPQPPAILIDVLTQLAGVARPDLVVDLGSGTGLSTLIWADAAAQVIGVEPNADMRAQAEARGTGLRSVQYRPGVSSDTGLPSGGADIVTVSQALHWMEPEPTFREAARILRPGGIFAAVDCDWPPTITIAAEIAYRGFFTRLRERGLLERADRDVVRWEKSGHLERMRQSSVFSFVKEIALHSVEVGDARRLVEVALSQGSVQALVQAGMSEEEIGLDTLRMETTAALHDEPWPWYWTYRVRIGVVETG
jgi:SAM-dependent methyltransferase